MFEKCDGTRCAECATERGNLVEQNHRDVEEFMAKKYGFAKPESGNGKPKNPFEALFSELSTDTSETTPNNTSEVFAKVLSTGNLQEIFSYIKETIKHTPSTTRTNFAKAQKTEDQRNVETFLKAIESGYIDSAMDSLNKMHKEITKQERNKRRVEIYG